MGGVVGPAWDMPVCGAGYEASGIAGGAKKFFCRHFDVRILFLED